MLRAVQECREAGCHELTREKNGYCEKHQVEAKGERRDKYNDFYNICWIFMCYLVTSFFS